MKLNETMKCNATADIPRIWIMQVTACERHALHRIIRNFHSFPTWLKRQHSTHTHAQPTNFWASVWIMLLPHSACSTNNLFVELRHRRTWPWRRQRLDVVQCFILYSIHPKTVSFSSLRPSAGVQQHALSHSSLFGCANINKMIASCTHVCSRSKFIINELRCSYILNAVCAIKSSWRLVQIYHLIHTSFTVHIYSGLLATKIRF